MDDPSLSTKGNTSFWQSRPDTGFSPGIRTDKLYFELITHRNTIIAHLANLKLFKKCVCAELEVLFNVSKALRIRTSLLSGGVCDKVVLFE